MKKKFLALACVSIFGISTLYAQTNFNYCPKLNSNLSNLSKSDKKQEVTDLQIFLKKNLGLGDNDFLVTGVYGKITKKYVTEFQSKNGLVPTGVVGKVTRNKIITLCSSGVLPQTSSSSSTKETVTQQKLGNESVAQKASATSSTMQKTQVVGKSDCSNIQIPVCRGILKTKVVNNCVEYSCLAP